MKTTLETLHILQDHFPERLHKCVFVRPPWVFNTAWNIVHPLVDPVTAEKVEFVNLAGEELRAKLGASVELSSLETRLGGDNAVPFDPAVYLAGKFELEFDAQLAASKAAEQSPGAAVAAASE